MKFIRHWGKPIHTYSESYTVSRSYLPDYPAQLDLSPAIKVVILLTIQVLMIIPFIK